MSPWRPLPDAEPPEPRPVGDSLDRVAGSLGVPRATTLTAVFGAWPELVGEGVAAHARPLSLRDGTLVVAVDEPGWATQLRWLEAELLAHLGDVAGEGSVTRISVVVRPPP